jgi:hypothetical protein
MHDRFFASLCLRIAGPKRSDYDSNYSSPVDKHNSPSLQPHPPLHGAFAVRCVHVHVWVRVQVWVCGWGGEFFVAMCVCVQICKFYPIARRGVSTLYCLAAFIFDGVWTCSKLYSQCSKSHSQCSKLHSRSVSYCSFDPMFPSP